MPTSPHALAPDTLAVQQYACQVGAADAASGCERVALPVQRAPRHPQHTFFVRGD